MMVLNPPAESPWLDLKQDRNRYRAEGRNVWWAEGFWILVVYRCGRKACLIQNRWARLCLMLPLLMIRKFMGIWLGITIPFSVRMGGGMFLPHCGGIVIHDDSVIGRQCAIYQGVTLGAKGSKHGAPQLGDRVNVGAGAVILGRVDVGDDVDIGANAVVLKDVPAHSIAVGVPAQAKSKANPESGRIFA